MPINFEKRDFTGQLGDIYRICGREAAVKMMNKFGGTIAWVPKGEISADHKLSILIGHENAVKIAKHFAGEQVNINLGICAKRRFRNQEIVKKFDAGTTRRQLVSEFGLTSRQISTILNKSN